MYQPIRAQTTETLLPDLTEDVASLAARLATKVVPLQPPFEHCLHRLFQAYPEEAASLSLSDHSRWIEQLSHDGQAVSASLSGHLSVVYCGWNTDLYRVKVGAIIAAPVPLAKMLMEFACEATRLGRQSMLLQMQLDASALQIAQSFEEQCWLRDLARNLSISSESANANVMAEGILRPLLDLLRSEDLFVLVREEETTRSGLASNHFGKSDMPIAQVMNLMHSLVAQKPTGPIVINKAQLAEGRVQSIVAVPIVSSDYPLGHIVAINRQNLQLGSGKGLALMDTEFGSVEVGLMEEASVLLGTQMHNIRLITESQHLALGTLQAMSRAIDARDPYTRGHSERVARLSFEIADILGLEETACQEIYVAGILHDVGKIGIPDRVLLKADMLSFEEFDIIKQHPEIGYRIIEQLGKLQFTLPGVLYHHERWDGGGYPHGLSGDQIPLMARIIAVADSFDAMTSSRPYRHAMPWPKACEIIRDGAGKQWDAMLVRCFQQWRQKRSMVVPNTPLTGVSLIPQEPPYADISQTILALQL